jgi:glycosyltransferase involved in cell wall biosynthesis
VLYLVRTIYQPDFVGLVWLLKRLFGTRVVFDFDDAKFLRRPRQILRLTRLADAVVVGSHALAGWASRHNPRVHIVPTSVPFEVYSRYTHDYAAERAGPATVGWIGIGPDHVANLALMSPALTRLRRAGVPVRFVLIGAQGRREVYDVFSDARAQGVEVEFIDELEWSRPERVASEIGRFEVGVMPLEDTEQNRGKCAFKAVEYMACGVATVCSAVGENLYARLGRAGQELVRERYSLEANAPRLREILAPLSSARREA